MSIPMEQMPDLIERMIRIETKLDVARDNHTDHETRIRNLESDNVQGGHQDHESRIRRLERSVWLAAGAAAAGGGIVGQIVGPMLSN